MVFFFKKKADFSIWFAIKQLQPGYVVLVLGRCVFFKPEVWHVCTLTVGRAARRIVIKLLHKEMLHVPPNH